MRRRNPTLSRQRAAPTILREVLLGDEAGDYECSFFDVASPGFTLTTHDAAKAVVSARCKQLGIKPIAEGWWFTNRNGVLEVQVSHRGWAPKAGKPKRRNPPTILRESLCADGDGTYECSFWTFPEGTPKAAARQVVAARCRELGIKPIASKWRIGPSSLMSFDLEVMVCHQQTLGDLKRNPMRAGTGDLHTLYRWALARAGISEAAIAKMDANAMEDAMDQLPGYPADETINDLMPAPLKKAFRKVATKKAWREMLTWEASCAVGFACGLRIDYALAHPSDDPTWEYTARDMLTFAFS